MQKKRGRKNKGEKTRKRARAPPSAARLLAPACQGGRGTAAAQGCFYAVCCRADFYVCFNHNRTLEPQTHALNARTPILQSARYTIHGGFGTPAASERPLLRLLPLPLRPRAANKGKEREPLDN